MGSLLGGAPKVAAPPPPPPLPEPAPVPEPKQPAGPEVSEARRRQQAAAALAQGRSATILTSGLGLTEPATTAPRTVLGV